MDMAKMEDFLSGIPSPQTRKSYKNGIRKFEEFHKKPIESLIKSEDAGRTVEKFYVYLRDKGFTQNSCRNIVNGAIQFLKYFDTTVKYRKSLGIYRTEVSTKDHLLSVKEVQEMGSVSSLKESIILEVFLMGLRAGDASRLEWRWFDVTEQTPPIPLELRTSKEGIVAYSFISEEFLGLLKKYLGTISKENKYLLQSKRQGYMDEESLNWTLKTLSKRANLNISKNLHWHLGRKLFLRTSAELGVNQWNAKLMCGKAVEKSIECYINGLSLKEDFLKVSEVLRLRKPNGNGKVTKLEEDVQLITKIAVKIIKELRGTEYATPSQGQYLGLVEEPSNEEVLKKYLES